MKNLGIAGEEIAFRYFIDNGWQILARNFRWRGGEVDIVATKEEVVSFIEVKTWNYFGIYDLESAISARKKKKIIETSKIFLNKYREYTNSKIRYDVVFIKLAKVYQHYSDAFTGEL